jgi:SAM-dependent methyltransferase
MDDPFANHKEPEEIFFPLSDKQYTEFYSIEMDSFSDDIEFYKKYCKKHSSVLELGCGTGRISRALSSFGCSVISLDLSFEMLQQGRSHPGNQFTAVCMDMTEMAFNRKFDHIIIPYNTLNLIRDHALIAKCLQQAHALLNPGATLLLQLHIPDPELLQSNNHKLFQFQIFPLRDRPGKLIKETLRWYLPEKKEIHLEERYRSRPTEPSTDRKDFHHTLCLAGFSLTEWLRLFEVNGFHDISLFGDYNSRPFQIEKDSTLLVKASRS